MDAQPRLSTADANRLRWRCRRGLLENDLLISRWLARHPDAISVRDAEGLAPLIALDDNDLLDLLMARREPEGLLAANPETLRVLAELRRFDA